MVKFTTEETILEFKIQTILVSIFKLGKIEKPIAPKILKQLPLPQANQVTTEVLSTAKNPSNYKDRKVQKKNEQIPIDIKMSDDDELVSPTMANITIDNFVKNTVDENVVKQRAAKRKMLEKQLSENTVRMNKIKKSNKL